MLTVCSLIWYIDNLEKSVIVNVKFSVSVLIHFIHNCYIAIYLALKFLFSSLVILATLSGYTLHI